MHSYKRRGQPDDPANLQAAAQEKLLSEAITVNSLLEKDNAAENYKLKKHVKFAIKEETPSKINKVNKKNIKTIPINVPAFGSKAIYNPKFNPSKEAFDILQKIRSINCCNEINPQEDEDFEEYSNSSTIKPTHSQHNTINLTKKLSTITQTTRNDNKRLIMTLTQLDERLKNMRAKYFNESPAKYKSINDFDGLTNKVKTIYKNDEFDPDQAMSTILSEASHSHILKDAIEKCYPSTTVYSGKQLKSQSFLGDKASSNKHIHWVDDINLVDDHDKFDEKNETTTCNQLLEDKSALEKNKINLSNTTKHASFVKESVHEPVKKGNAINIKSESSNGADNILGNLNDVINKSDYLSREFNKSAVNFSRIPTLSKSPSALKSASCVNKKSTTNKNRFIKASISHQLKNTVFDQN